MTDQVVLADFPHLSREKIRFRDTDMQGHVNNSVYMTLFEQGRIEVLFNDNQRLDRDGAVFVVAHIAIDFLNELTWPGEVTIGTCVAGHGRSSLQIAQAIFQDNQCVATAKSVVVLMDTQTRRSTPLSEFALSQLQKLIPNKPNTDA